MRAVQSNNVTTSQDLIDHLPHPGVSGNGLYLKEGREVIHVGLIFHSLLKLEKGGVLEEHHGESTHEHIVHQVIRLDFLTGIDN